MTNILLKSSKTRNLYSWILAAAVFSLGANSIAAQDLVNLDDERTKQLQELGVLLPNPEEIKRLSSEEFGKPLDQQDAEVLDEIARDANTYANLVSKITDEYDDYIRDNSRYDFVVEEVQKAPVVDVYLTADNEFKTIRNQAYLNLGKIALADGDQMKAFLLLNDAFRLSPFSCANGTEGCIRYEAEQLMKGQLGIEGQSYINWEK
tara:strand:- start:4670 stop:5287 length:618 start_codon:yes stop_codon:yes gene_type:complete